MEKRKIDTKLVADVQKYAGADVHHMNNRLQAYYVYVDVQDIENIDRLERELRIFVYAKKKAARGGN